MSAQNTYVISTNTTTVNIYFATLNALISEEFMIADLEDLTLVIGGQISQNDYILFTKKIARKPTCFNRRMNRV
jgi:hypothetical protein